MTSKAVILHGYRYSVYVRFVRLVLAYCVHASRRALAQAERNMRKRHPLSRDV
jgi:hypothetical protein